MMDGLSEVLDKAFTAPLFIKKQAQPNVLMEAMMGHNKWYVKPFIRFQPKWIHTFTERPHTHCGSGLVQWFHAPYGVEHGYWCHHPLEFLYNWARRFATRKHRFRKETSVQGQSFTVPLRGKLPE